MSTSLSALLTAPEFRLMELHRGAAYESAISWASSSDLLDPTPFLVADQLLLTTGRQFTDDFTDVDFSAYVDRLVRSDVIGIGFGTEVLPGGTPPGLVAACQAADLGLVEVPYRTPFLAIIRRIAHEIERDARLRDDWALSASRSLSSAALGGGEVPAVLRELARLLRADVHLFGIDREVTHTSAQPSSMPDPAIDVAVRQLLDAGTVAAREVDVDGEPTLLQTIGPTGSLAGVLAITGPRPDRAARTVLAAAVAFVEIGVTVSRRAVRSKLARDSVILRLLRERRADLAVEVAAAAGMRLAGDAVLVASAADEAATATLAEREAGAENRLVLIDKARLVIVANNRVVASTARRLATEGHRVGTASLRTLDDIDLALARADAARARARDGHRLDWSELPLDATDAPTAALRIAMIATTEQGSAEIAAAEAWFEENCNWGAAARRLDLHPHTVRGRVESLARRLELDLAAFSVRVQLWRALEAFRTR